MIRFIRVNRYRPNEIGYYDNKIKKFVEISPSSLSQDELDKLKASKDAYITKDDKEIKLMNNVGSFDKSKEVGSFDRSKVVSPITKPQPKVETKKVKQPYSRAVAEHDVVGVIKESIKRLNRFYPKDDFDTIVNQAKLTPSRVLNHANDDDYMLSYFNAILELKEMGLLNKDKTNNYLIHPYCLDTSKPEDKRKYYAELIIKSPAFNNAMGNTLFVEEINSDTVLGRKEDGSPIYDIKAIKISLKIDGKVIASETYETSFLTKIHINEFSDAYKETLNRPENKAIKERLDTLRAKETLAPEEEKEFEKIIKDKSPNDLYNDIHCRKILYRGDAMKMFIKNAKENGKIQGVRELAVVKEKINLLCSTSKQTGDERLSHLINVDRTVIKYVDKNIPLQQRIVYIDNRASRGEEHKPFSLDNSINISLFNDDGSVKLPKPKVYKPKFNKKNDNPPMK